MSNSEIRLNENIARAIKSCFPEKRAVAAFRSHSDQRGRCWNSQAQAHDSSVPPLAAAARVTLAVPTSSLMSVKNQLRRGRPPSQGASGEDLNGTTE